MKGIASNSFFFPLYPMRKAMQGTVSYWFIVTLSVSTDRLKKHLLVALVLFATVGWSQDCPAPVFPQDGETVPVESVISWSQVFGITAYKIRVGTTPGGNEISPLVSTGLATSFSPPLGLPESTQIFVSLYIFNRTQGDTLCVSYSFFTNSFTSPPGCTTIASPADGENNVPVQSVIRWRYSPTATSYRLSVGTSPGGSELVNDQVITDLSYVPPADLPPETDIYVRIIPENRLGVAVNCGEFSFRTGPLATLPACTTIIYPQDQELDVPLSPIISWNAVTGAEGYLVSIGTTPTLNDILDNADFRNITQTGVINFEPNRQYFITITPYNIAGLAQGCIQTSFFTFLGCGPYFDVLGNLVDLTPVLTFPTTIGICASGDTSIRATDYGSNVADGYRWYSVPVSGPEILLTEGVDFDIPGDGEYRLEIYDIVSGASGNFECPNSQIFEVSQSEEATIEGTDIQLGAGFIDVTVSVSGLGDYEFALDNVDGPYQDSNRFRGLAIDNYTIYVRDKNGCGIVDVPIEPDLTLEGFPEFFTPNGDGVHDLWQFILPPSGINPIRELFIFDRYGQLLAQVDPLRGWDGTFNGQPMPASDYWFRAVDNNNQEVTGHFTLKR